MNNPLGKERPNDAQQIAAFLDSIAGHGYGGMAEYEIARKAAHDLADTVEFAYGLLWHAAGAARHVPTTVVVGAARQELLKRIDKAGQARGISKAREAL
jgi:hypothetical protein